MACRTVRTRIGILQPRRRISSEYPAGPARQGRTRSNSMRQYGSVVASRTASDPSASWSTAKPIALRAVTDYRANDGSSSTTSIRIRRASPYCALPGGFMPQRDSLVTGQGAKLSSSNAIRTSGTGWIDASRSAGYPRGWHSKDRARCIRPTGKLARASEDAHRTNQSRSLKSRGENTA